MPSLEKDSPFRGKKKAFIKQKIYNMLKENIQLNTREIQDLMNKNTRCGVTMQELANILARTPQFERIGDIDVSSLCNRMRVAIWGIKYES